MRFIILVAIALIVVFVVVSTAMVARSLMSTKTQKKKLSRHEKALLDIEELEKENKVLDELLRKDKDL